MADETLEKMESTSLVLPEIKAADILKDSEVQSIIAQSMEDAAVKWEEIEKYYREGLEIMFANQNMTLAEFTKVFEQVVDIDQAKEDAKKVIDDYSKYWANDDINTALSTLDEELNEISPLFAKIKDTLEWGATIFDRIINFVKGIFWGQNDDLISSSLQGIKWRVDSISEAFEKYEQQLKLNQMTAEKYIPQLGVEIYKTDGMARCLEVVRKKVEHDGTREFLNNMVAQLHTISGIKKWNLQRFIMAARMNGNSQLLLRATEFKVFGVMPSLLALNFVLGTQKKVNEISDLWDDFMKEMVEASKTQLDSNMNSEVEAKNKMIDQLKKITGDIDRLEQRVSDHKENLWLAQKALDDYMPIYKENIKKLDESIFDTNISDSDFIKVSGAIIEKLEEQKEELATEIVEWE